MIARLNSWLFFAFFLLLPTQLGKHFFFDFSYVNGVRIDYLAPTVYLIDFVVIGLMVVNWRVVLRSFAPLRMTKEDSMTKLLWSAAITLVGVNIVLARESMIALYTTVRYVEMGIVFIILRSLTSFEMTRISLPRTRLLLTMISALFIGAAVEFGLSLYQIWAQHSAQGLFYWLGERSFSISTPGIATISLFDTIALRPYGTFSHPNSLGGFYALVYVFFLMSRFMLSRQARIMQYGLVMISGFLVLMSFSKVAIGTVLFTTLYYVLRVLKIDCWWCKWGRVFTISIISLLFLSGKSDIVSLDKRLALAQSSVHSITNHPFFGTGLGNSLYSQSVMSQQLPYFFLQPVHNVFLLFMSEAGLVMTAVTALFVWREIRRSGILKQAMPAGRQVQDEDRKRALLSIAVVIIITGSFDHYWLTLIQNQLSLAAFLGVTIGIKRATT